MNRGIRCVSYMGIWGIENQHCVLLSIIHGDTGLEIQYCIIRHIQEYGVQKFDTVLCAILGDIYMVLNINTTLSVIHGNMGAENQHNVIYHIREYGAEKQRLFSSIHGNIGCENQ